VVGGGNNFILMLMLMLTCLIMLQWDHSFTSIYLVATMLMMLNLMKVYSLLISYGQNIYDSLYCTKQ